MKHKTSVDLRLDYFYDLICSYILKYQNAATGLIVNASVDDGDVTTPAKFGRWSMYVDPTKETPRPPQSSQNDIYRLQNRVIKWDLSFDMSQPASASNLYVTNVDESNRNHSWVRDNIYCTMAVWGLAMAYRKLSDQVEGKTRAYELQKAVVKAMRGLLCSMQMQTEKVERFKKSQAPTDALHAKYSSINGRTVVGDLEWGHLQLDATSLYLLTLAQMTASGIVIIFTLDEVTFIQNLVFYIQNAYRTPDYGIWERGDKTNHGLPELNASSIALAKAALEAINELDLFGGGGGPSSVIYVIPDEANQCRAILHSMLPRESISKETGASLLTAIGFPAFAVDDPRLVALTKETILTKLEGSYGMKRFLRDGYKTAVEDSNRQHYEPQELSAFEGIECQWPLFFTFMVLDGCFTNNMEQAQFYEERLLQVMLISASGHPVVPELYTVPKDLVPLEYETPNSQRRVAAGRIPHMWSQAMFILGQLMIEGFLAPGELDPLNRRFVTEEKFDVVVQVVILCEDKFIKDNMAAHGIELQTVDEVAPFKILPASILSKLYNLLGKNKRLGLTGQPYHSNMGLLTTSKLYNWEGNMLAFTPPVADSKQFYLGLDVEYLLDDFTTRIDTLGLSWRSLGRPLIIYILPHASLDKHIPVTDSLLKAIRKVQSGTINGTRVIFGRLADFQNTSCVTPLSFLRTYTDSLNQTEAKSIEDMIKRPSLQHRLSTVDHDPGHVQRASLVLSQMGISGISRPRRSSAMPNEASEMSLGLRKESQAALSSAISLNLAPSKLDNMLGSPTDSVETFPVTPLTATAAAFRHITRESLLKVQHLQPDLDDEEVETSRLLDIFDKEEGDDQLETMIQLLKASKNIMDQADIIHYLFVHKGPYWDTGIDPNARVLVIDLINEIYLKASHLKQWWLVRHTAGLLRKRVLNLAPAVTNLLVRQKQLTVGLPPDREVNIQVPMPPDELASMIFESCGDDFSMASLTQELLVYLAMYIQTEPRLFSDMLRLRVGLIIQIMVTELARVTNCCGEDALGNLMNLSPFEMKTLLHHILSGREFVVTKDMDITSEKIGATIMKRRRTVVKIQTLTDIQAEQSSEKETDEDSERHGQWLRRRRLDGSLNRVPAGFYPQLWEFLNRCQGLIVRGNILPGTLTSEMTQQEFKFALSVESVLNNIPYPEYRQLTVEAMMVLTMLMEKDGGRIDLRNTEIVVDSVLAQANELYIAETKLPPDVVEKTKGPEGISLFLYDSAPAGRYGSLTYICQALMDKLNLYQLFQ